jgi:hypothetical protein
MVEFVPRRKPKYQRKLSAKEMFVDLANTELRAQADPYIRGNPIRRLAWDAFIRGGTPGLVSGHTTYQPTKTQWSGESKVISQVLQTALPVRKGHPAEAPGPVKWRKGRKAQGSGLGGEFIYPGRLTKKELQEKSIPAAPNFYKPGPAGKADPKKANIIYRTGSDYTYQQDLSILGHELEHFGGWITQQDNPAFKQKGSKGKVPLIPWPSKPNIPEGASTAKFIEEHQKHQKGAKTAGKLLEKPVAYSDYLIESNPNVSPTVHKAYENLKGYSKHYLPDKFAKEMTEVISSAATELLIARGVPKEIKYKRTTN